MKIVVSANGYDLDAPASPVFGRCPVYVFVDTETMAFEAVDNPAQAASGGAGIQAAQFVVNHGAQAVLSGNVGPNAFDVLAAANVPVYLVAEGTVRDAVEAFKAGRLQRMDQASVRAHAGMRGGRGMGMRGGMGGSRGMGAGRGMTSSTTPPSTNARTREIEELKGQARELRQQLAQLLDRIDQLERGS
ncbi:MAG: dinitrogenase iron-molybdenum cofactor biosynthesis protein [Chloroflexi bacterium]|nr:dinitrogenase iron-molybdenum cofactor biosynthesis protein [Chloroflexota bacterium]